MSRGERYPSDAAASVCEVLQTTGTTRTLAGRSCSRSALRASTNSRNS